MTGIYSVNKEKICRKGWSIGTTMQPHTPHVGYYSWCCHSLGTSRKSTPVNLMWFWPCIVI